ncbi:CocE/NonD family hydrolase [Nocardia sp. NPDC004068]|uniref:CocE/NonD family hydrolase n=1 Tax=Nocardia sp. NPDC004068 TaxID=3364303 RepID=UPI0036A5679F
MLRHDRVDVPTADELLVSRGYVHVVVDVRGTGSSTGVWDVFDPREQQDYSEVLQWVREQPWSNGDTALTGVSYHALAALLAAFREPAGLKAVFVMEAADNFATEIGITGGVPSLFLMPWFVVVNGLKWFPSRPPVRRYLRDRFTVPFSWFNRLIGMYIAADHPDHYFNDYWAAKIAEIENIRVPTFLYGAWHDLFNRSPLCIYNRLNLPPGEKQVLVDEGYHLSPGAGFGDPHAPQDIGELRCAWFDHWVNGIPNRIEEYGPITVYRRWAGWVSYRTMPHPEAVVHRHYLSAERSGSAGHAGYDGSLRSDPPERTRRLRVPERPVRIASDSTAIVSMGLALALGRGFGRDERNAESSALTFTTAPFASDTVLSGGLNLHLYVDTAGTDAFWSATVSNVAGDGRSSVVARGALRSSRRGVDETRSRYRDGELVDAVHPLTEATVLPVRPGAPHEIDISMNITDAVFRTGHRLRVAIRRNDFPRYVLTPSIRRRMRRQAVLLSPDHPSYLTMEVGGSELDT